MIDWTLTNCLGLVFAGVGVVAGKAVWVAGVGDEGEVVLGVVDCEEVLDVVGGGDVEWDRLVVKIPNPDRVRLGWGAFFLRSVVDDDGEEEEEVWRGLSGWSVVSRAGILARGLEDLVGLEEGRLTVLSPDLG